MSEQKQSLQQGILSGLNAIVTGGAQGLGLGMATSFAKYGAKVFILDKNIALAKESAQALPGSGHDAFECDITDAKMRKTAIENVVATAGRIDVLVNNAGITHIQEAENMDETAWKEVFEVNIHGGMFMSRDVAAYMIAQGSGSIINIGSITSLVAFPGRSVYCTTKTAVIGLTRSLAIDFAQKGIRVNAIGPGYHETALFKKYVDNGLIDREKIRKRIPMGRLGSIEDVGEAAVFFASPLSKYVTGQFLMVDGGYTAFGAAQDASI